MPQFGNSPCQYQRCFTRNAKTKELHTHAGPVRLCLRHFRVLQEAKYQNKIEGELDEFKSPEAALVALMSVDPIKPWNWATVPPRRDPVEIVSYPFPKDDGTTGIAVRRMLGDPNTLEEVNADQVSAFPPTVHEWYMNRERVYYDPNNPTAFYFKDDDTPKQEDLNAPPTPT